MIVGVDLYRMYRFFKNVDSAREYMTLVNRLQTKETFCLVEGPKSFGVIDVKTATDLGLPYECSVKESDRAKYRSFQPRRKLFGLINW
jgi:hypothetical protein